MGGFEEVLERLLTDPEFRGQLASDPASALSAYELTGDQMELLASGLADSGGHSRVEQRTSKAGLAGILEALGSGTGLAADDADVGEPASGRVSKIDSITMKQKVIEGDGSGDHLGHTLGLRHEHTRPGWSAGGGSNEIRFDDMAGIEAPPGSTAQWSPTIPGGVRVAAGDLNAPDPDQLAGRPTDDGRSPGSNGAGSVGNAADPDQVPDTSAAEAPPIKKVAMVDMQRGAAGQGASTGGDSPTSPDGAGAEVDPSSAWMGQMEPAADDIEAQSDRFGGTYLMTEVTHRYTSESGEGFAADAVGDEAADGNEDQQ